VIKKQFPHEQGGQPTLRISRRRPLKIGVDVRTLSHFSTRTRGIGRYLRNQLRALLTLAPDCQFTLYGDGPIWNQDFVRNFLSYKNCRYSPHHPSFWKDLDLFHLTDPLPLIPKVPLLPFDSGDLPLVATIYDLIPLAFRQVYLDERPAMRREYEEKIAFLKDHCAKFLAISNFVADDVRNRLQVDDQRVIPILGGLDPVFLESPKPQANKAVRQKYELDNPYFIYTGGIDFRKNVATLLIAFAQVAKELNVEHSLVFTGELGEEVLQKIAERLRCQDVLPKIRPLGYVSDDELRSLYAGATAMVFPSLYEGFGFPALEAMACGAPVIASARGSLPEIVGSAGILIDPQDSEQIATAMIRLAADTSERQRLAQEGRQRARMFQWETVADKTLTAYHEVAPRARPTRRKERRLRVLLQNRASALSHPGGDTGVMNGLHDGLTKYDVEVCASAEPGDLDGIDIVHLINLTTVPASRDFAQNALRQKVPYVITTLYEDWPSFLAQSNQSFFLFEEYVRSGCDKEQFQRHLEALRHLPAAEKLENAAVASGARALLACGESEAARLKRDFPFAAEQVHVVPFGIRVLEEFSLPDKEEVLQRLGVERYALCVGRLETRKNQLMLMKALEDDDLALLFITGGFTYQPAYEELCRSFRRRGPALFLGRVSDTQLATLYSAAACHVLPSWYELPGLVSLEAAAYGCAVVASTWGSIEDYLPAGGFGACQPDDPVSIRTAVHAALESKPDPTTAQRALQFTWQRSAEHTLRVYEQILSATAPQRQSRHKRESTATPLNLRKEQTMVGARGHSRHQFACSIILSVQNGADDTEACLEAISADQSAPDYEVIIVNNGSTDRTPKLLNAIEGDVQILTESEPVPRARALNLAAKRARGEHLVFLDNATEPRAGWLKHLVERAQSSPEIHCVGAKLIHTDNTIEHTGFLFRKDKVPFSAYRGFAADHPAVNHTRKYQATSGACLLVRRSIFEQLGGFDERLADGFEAIDLCLRVCASGGKVVYSPEATVLYRGTAALGLGNWNRDKLQRFLTIWADRIIYDEAKVLAEDGFRIQWDDSGQPRYLELKGLVHEEMEAAREQRTTRDAEAVWTSLKRLVGSSACTPEKMAEFCQLSIELDRAVEAEKTLAGLTPDRTILLQHAQLLYHLEKFEGAVEKLRQLTEHFSELSEKERFESWQLLGNCCTRLERTEEAEKAYLHALLENPSSERPYLGLGSVALSGQNWQAAQYGFAVATAHNPDSPRAHFGLGLALSARGMKEAAAREFATVLEQHPHHPEALFNLYKIAMEMEKPEMAEIPLKTYLEKHPDDPDFLFNLCGLQFKMGQYASAIETCRRVVSLKPDYTAAREVLEQLEKPL
jgi:glycosyltransferase involved in cell wall biosynthesis/GT2 family glycosyltransferase/Flp pilus assembly protein TadD